MEVCLSGLDSKASMSIKWRCGSCFLRGCKDGPCGCDIILSFIFIFDC